MKDLGTTCYLCSKRVYDETRGKHKNGGITFNSTISKTEDYGGTVKIIEKNGSKGTWFLCKDCASKLPKNKGMGDYIIDKRENKEVER